MRRARALTLWLAASAVTLAGCASPVVGGECREGLLACDGRCIDPRTDPENCGACGNVCAPGAMCVGGACTPGPLDGGPPDAGQDGAADDAGPDASVDGGPDAGDGGSPLDADNPDAMAPDGGDGGSGDGGSGDGGVGDGGADAGDGGSACDIGELRCDGTCVRPSTDPDHCGSCGNSCAAEEVCADGTCSPVCEAPLSLCGGTCVDTSSHPDHCGSCGDVCASGICRDGVCASATYGHVVVVGHDYERKRRGMNRVVGNAAFLARGAPLQVLVYEGESQMRSIRHTDQAIDQVAAESGRSWTRDAAEAAEVPLRLAKSDVFVVYSQHGATDDELHVLGMQWGTALTSFLRRGGVVVVLDAGGSHDGTWQVLQPAGLFDATGRVDVSGAEVEVVAPADAVALDVPPMYLAETSSVRFSTTEPGAVVAHPDGPVVLHRVMSP